MKHARLSFALAGSLVAVLTGPIRLAAQQAVVEPPDVAAPKRDREGKIQPIFQRAHEEFLRRGRQGPIGVLFLGDSITERWRIAREVWDRHFGRYSPANFGLGGDRTQHVLWRIEDGELDGIHPKVVVLMIGSNNIGDRVPEVVRAEKKIVETIHRKLPGSRLLLLGILPRGADASDRSVANLRAKIAAVNVELARLDDGSRIRYLDLAPKLLDAQGNLPAEYVPDGVHPSAKGYELWADAMQPLLDEMMK